MDDQPYFDNTPDASRIKPVKLPVLRTIPSPSVTAHEKMVAGELYGADETVVNGRYFGKVCMHVMNTASPMETEKCHCAIGALLGTKSGAVWIEPPFYCDIGANIHMGKGSFMDSNCTVLDGCPVHIGPRCIFGPNVSIYTATHPIEPKARSMWEYSKPVAIGADCWIGGGTMILPGVTIGDCVVVGAGSVVTKDVPAYTVVAGNPSRKIRDVPRLEEDAVIHPSK